MTIAMMHTPVSEIDDRTRRLRLLHSSVREVSQPASTRIGPRLQRGIQLILVHSGRMTVSIDDRAPYDVTAGHMCILLPGHTELIAFPPDSDTRQTLLGGVLDDLSPQMHQWLEAVRPMRPLSAALTYLAREAVVTTQTRLTAHGALIDALATSLLWRFIAEFENSPAALPGPIETARLFIHNHLTEQINLADVAGAAFVTSPHLVRLFREHMDTTPMRYLWNRRITLGIELLTDTGLTVAAVAERSGFKTSFHFARRIREATGLTPTELRTSKWQADPTNPDWFISGPTD